MFARIVCIFLPLIICNYKLIGQNPISPPGVYIADPSAHFWDDGNLYIYGSNDESCDYYCSGKYHILSTKDLINWQLHEYVFSSEGDNDAVSYNDLLLFAPDCAVKNDTFYLYYCQPSPENAEGVAVSNNPSGPFLNGQEINLNGFEQIDPAVFQDDDGQIYYIWGQFSLKMAKMNTSMKSLELESIQDSILTENEHHFHEGAFMAKRDSTYYLIYTDISRGDIPTCIGYATSTSPLGPYEYGGVIIDNNHCNPGNWNNHGSIAKFDDQWYVFYHRSTHGCRTMRKACVEPITFNPDGSIPEVEMTSQGANQPLDADEKIQAEWACILHGNLRSEEFENKMEVLTKTGYSNLAAYKYIDFNDINDSLTIKYLPGQYLCKIIFCIDKPWHNRIASIAIEGSENPTWQTRTFPIKQTSGVQALWLIFASEEEDNFALDWFRFVN